jgi:FKBP-type peptidyl-prolyl cis-trans isomerase (trigger factor)
LYQAAQESGITVSEEDIEAGYAQVREEFDGDEMALADALFESGMTGEDLRAEIGERLRVQAYIETEIDPEDLHISDEDVETAYANYVEEMKDVPPLEEVFEEMRDQVEEQRLQQAVLVLIDKLREQSEVEVYI